MKKYPSIALNEIIKCVQKVNKFEFNTYDFIDIWSTTFPKSYSYFSSIGVGWKKMVGKNLSVNAGKFSSYKIIKGKKKSGAQQWTKL